jgi:hypothetical protein
VPYIVPSENGGRADTRWVAVREAEGGVGLAVMPCDGTPPMQVGRAHHTPFERHASAASFTLHPLADPSGDARGSGN